LPELIEYRVIETLLHVESGDYKKASQNLLSGDKSKSAHSFFNFLAKVYVEFMVYEVVKDGKELLESDVQSKDEELGISESPKLSALLNGDSPARIKISKASADPEESKTNILVPFELPSLITNDQNSESFPEEKPKLSH